ncbi:MAG: SemiSWEET family sugar transporter [Saprospiraceae bacterium]|nr:SemiSWEET family sugar transporter [Saprospiraceae bacterium]
MEWSTVIGNVAAVLTTFSFVPQVLKTIRTRDTSGISLPMYALFVTGIGFWLIYGLMTNSQPIILANSITFVLAGIVLVFKIRSLR